jgi:hypothetical protein
VPHSSDGTVATSQLSITTEGVTDRWDKDLL